MSGMGTFTQFAYCSMCKISYKKSRKHVYSTKHQEIVTNILKKFRTKIQNAKSNLLQPSVNALTVEDKEKFFWCYFCGKDFPVHIFREQNSKKCFISNGGILEHISGTEHGLFLDKFFKENKVDIKRKEEFIMTSQGYMKFLEVADSVCGAYFIDKEMELNKIASEIAVQTFHSQRVVRETVLDKNDNQPTQSIFELTDHEVQMWRESSEFEQPRKTVKAFGVGLTVVDRTQEDDSKGNIYTNALPPWLMSETLETSCTQSGKIMPDIEQWEKYKKLQKKSLLSSERVGAKFDHHTEQSNSWLPSFGGVWQHSARTHSMKRFHKRKNMKDVQKKKTQQSGKFDTSSISNTSANTFEIIPSNDDFNRPNMGHIYQENDSALFHVNCSPHPIDVNSCTNTTSYNGGVHQNFNFKGGTSHNFTTNGGMSQNFSTSGGMSQNLNPNEERSQNHRCSMSQNFVPNGGMSQNFNPNSGISQNFNSNGEMSQNFNLNVEMPQHLNANGRMTQNLYPNVGLPQNFNVCGKIFQRTKMYNTQPSFSETSSIDSSGKSHLNTSVKVKPYVRKRTAQCRADGSTRLNSSLYPHDTSLNHANHSGHLKVSSPHVNTNKEKDNENFTLISTPVLNRNHYKS